MELGIAINCSMYCSAILCNYIVWTSAATNPTTTKSVLAAQTGHACFLTPTQSTGVYYLVVNDIHPVTTLFERRLVATLSTANFTAGFFGTDQPNAAVTIWTNETRISLAHQDIFIATLSDPFMTDTSYGSGISYTVSQSPSQADVLSLDSFYERQAIVENGCSIFLDEL